ncbi:hypothetical protein VCSRO191_3237 [Vibrio cholerae]|nr:hypothetical protein VCSRO191_3237 [Vibrio cholerae]
MRITRHYVTGSLWQNDSASCPRSAASEAVSAGAMVLTTAPQHNAAPHNTQLYHNHHNVTLQHYQLIMLVFQCGIY